MKGYATEPITIPVVKAILITDRICTPECNISFANGASKQLIGTKIAFRNTHTPNKYIILNYSRSSIELKTAP